jgi:hypothetical protein
MTFFIRFTFLFGSSGNIKPQSLEVSKIRGEMRKTSENFGYL